MNVERTKLPHWSYGKIQIERWDQEVEPITGSL